MNADLLALAAALPHLPARDQGFAKSLLSQAERGLSEKQMYWVRKLATAPAATPAATATVGDFSAVVALLAKAREHLKFPKVRLQLEDGRPVVLNIAGPASRYAGSINVTSGGGYANATWYGRVDPVSGTWTAGHKADAATTTAVVALLTAFAADPAKVATAYGQLVGSCCFCGLTLTDQRSVRVGYGPICAGHYGLPWGE